MAYQKNPNNDGKKQQQSAALDLTIQVIDKRIENNIFKVWIEALVTRGNKTASYVEVIMQDSNKKDIKKKALETGRCVFTYEAPLEEKSKLETLRFFLRTEAKESTVSIGIPALPSELKENTDPERLEVNSWIVSDSGLLVVNLRLIAARGKALEKRNVKIVFPNYFSCKYQYTVKTDELGHVIWECPFLIHPGTETMMLISVDYIDPVCEVNIKNLCPYVPPTTAEKMRMFFFRISFWLFGPLALLSPVVFLFTFIRIVGTNASERMLAKETSHDTWLVLLIIIFLFIDLIFLINTIFFFIRLRSHQFIINYRYKRSRRTKTNTKDPLWENIVDSAKEYFKSRYERKNQEFSFASSSNSASGHSSAKESDVPLTKKGFAAIDFKNELYSDGIYKILGFVTDKIKKYFKK
jgi:hypothetical protein